MSRRSSKSGHAVIISIVVVIVVAIVVVLGLVFWNNFTKKDSVADQPKATTIASFDDCKNAAGSKILETYPEQCVSSDGKTFTNTNAVVKTTEYCTEAEKLCFDLPDDWKVQQSERGEFDGSAFEMDKLSISNSDSSLFINVTTGISGLGGTCEPNEEAFTVVSSVPSALSVVKDDYNNPTANVVNLVTKVDKGYEASLFLSSKKEVAKAGEQTDTCNLSYATVMPGKNSHPFGVDGSAGAMVVTLSTKPNESMLDGDSKEFSTKAEAVAIFSTKNYQQAATILTSVHYKN